jgi:AcrR family transcriptional regulator
VGRRRRRYVSERRARQAAATREAILAAGRFLLERRGYAATTFAAIARRAGVALPTVYAVFGSKAALLVALVQQVKSEIQVPEAFRAMLAAPAPETKLRIAARVTRDYSEAGVGVLDALRVAGADDRALARVWTDVEETRRRGQGRLVDQIAGAGRLRPGLTRRSATDVFWALSAHDTWRLLVRASRWSANRFERWLGDSLIALLLDGGGPVSGGARRRRAPPRASRRNIRTPAPPAPAPSRPRNRRGS